MIFIQRLKKYKIPLVVRWVEYSARLVLAILTGMMSYVILLPSYNFAHLVPHHQLDAIGMSYNNQLWMEQHADTALHFGGAVVLVLLIVFANFFPTRNQAKIALIIVIMLCLGAELAQLMIGRGFDEYDLLFGISGSFMAYLTAVWLTKRSKLN